MKSNKSLLGLKAPKLTKAFGKKKAPTVKGLKKLKGLGSIKTKKPF